MEPLEFARWLQGFAELSPAAPTDEQWGSIKEHLQLVFQRVTGIQRIEPGRSTRKLC